METKSTKEKKKVVALNPQAPKKESNEVNTANTQEGKKYSYEELETIAKNLVEQYNAVRMKLAQCEELLQVKRLDYLFEVIKAKEVFSKKFFNECVKEIETSLAIPEEIEPKDKKSE